MSINKRRHKTLTLQDKMDIISKIDNGENMREIAGYFGIGRSTVHDINKKRGKIMDYLKSMDYRASKKKTMKASDYPKMEVALYNWFIQERMTANFISSDQLQIKAREFYRRITNKDNFRASNGWFDRFKKRFGIRLSTGENQPTDNDTVFKDKLAAKVEELGLFPDQLYNADEVTLFWQSLPKKVNSNIIDRKLCKDRITFMPCSNATGTHKLDLLIIGRYKNPKSLKNISLPVCYKNQFRSWLNRSHFNDWFHDEFVPSVRIFMRANNLPEKALLILDNAPSHPNEEDLISNDGNIQAIFLLPNSSLQLQPVKKLNTLIKERYKKILLLNMITDGGNIMQHLKQITLREVITSLVDAWNSVQDIDIRSSWMKLWPNYFAGYELDNEDDCLSNSDLEAAIHDLGLNETEVMDWLHGNDQIMTDSEICDDAILDVHIDYSMPKRKFKRIKKTMPEGIPKEKALQCFETCICWAEENDVSKEDILVLKAIKDRILVSRRYSENKITIPVTENC